MKLLIFFSIVILLIACKGGAGKTEASDTANKVQNNIVNTGSVGTDDAQNMSGSNLIAANDCLTCHKINEASTGPSYEQVAAKYEMNQGNIENLAGRIIKGGKGLWGQNAMTPHPNLSEQEAQEMVRYILSLRNSSAATK